MIVPMTASTLNTAVAIRWFLNLFISRSFAQRQQQITIKNPPRSWKTVIKEKAGGWEPDLFLVLMSVNAVTVSTVPSPL
jgi:hypothetical protein